MVKDQAKGRLKKHLATFRNGRGFFMPIAIIYKKIAGSFAPPAKPKHGGLSFKYIAGLVGTSWGLKSRGAKERAIFPLKIKFFWRLSGHLLEEK